MTSRTSEIREVKVKQVYLLPQQARNAIVRNSRPWKSAHGIGGMKNE